jgi:predicted amidohydrolase YtcJ
MIKSNISATLVALLITACLNVAAQNKILYNGTIYTVDDKQPKVEAVAISGDKIIAVGDLKTVKAKAGKNLTMVDLQGKYLLPGLIDSHNHAISGGETLESATLNDVLLTKEELRQFAEATLKTKKGMRGDVLYIGGFHSGTWASSKDLDELFNGNDYHTQAVVLRGSDGHTAWVNDVMLMRAGIDKNYVKNLSDDDRKFFGTDASGEPNGLISEDGFARIRSVLPSTKVDINHAGLLGVQHLNGLGITAWLDPSTGDISEGDNNGELNVYKKLSAEKNLTAHVVGVVVADGNANVDQQIAVIRKLQEQFRNVKDVEVIGFKIFADGVLEYPTQTGAISIPYKNSGQKGSLMFDPIKFKTFVATADKEKLLVHIHAIGDRAVTESLDAYAVARKQNGNSGITHSITHLQLVKPSDFNRFKALNIMTSSQLLWATADMYTLELVNPYVDESLAAHHYPAKSLLNAGAVIAGASDWPVSSANPFEAIAVAETRTGKLGVLDAKEVMPRNEMIKAYTINAARLMMKDKSIGSIEVGKQADFVLLDRDVMKVDAYSIKATQVLWTMFAGEKVFEKQ